MATMLLGDLGADVFKVEPPSGDQTRKWAPPYIQGLSAYFMSANRNKRSISIDLKKPEGLDLLKKLAKEVDVIIENFRPGTLERLGFSQEEAMKVNPKLIFCSLSGFGQTGPQKDWPGYDLTVLASSGLLSLNGEEGRTPIKFGVPIADIVSGMFADIAIISALYERTQSGKGQYIDMSMLDGNFLILSHQAFSYLATGKNPRKLGSAHSSIAPYQVFRTSDGFIAIAVGTEKLWGKFCESINRKDLVDNPLFISNTERVQNRDQLVEELERTLTKQSTEELFSVLQNAGIPVAPINSVGDAIKSEQLKSRDMVTKMKTPYGEIPMLGTPFKMSRTPGKLTRAPPELGADTVEILSNAGYTREEIDQLIKNGVVKSNK